VNLSTTYLGFALPHPLMPGASPLADDLDMVRRLEDAGTAAVVMRSLFEEQITHEAEAPAHFPSPRDYAFAPDGYLEQIRRIKAAVKVPVIGSLNGTSPEGWLHYARLIQEAGADALELNFYHLAADPRETSADVERRLLEIVHGVSRTVTIPVAVKVLPYFSSMAHLAHELEAAGADGLVLFNRFHQPDIDVEMLEVVPQLHWSTPEDLLLRVRWLAILAGRFGGSLAATGGVHTGLDAVKTVLAGADAVQLTTALLRNGPKHLVVVRRELAHWLEASEFDSLRQAQGRLSLLRCREPEAFERGQYLRTLQTWRV
jgi:dihydroorotate dehydrogenase (fumarate)